MTSKNKNIIMNVIKRNGTVEKVSFDKITKRIEEIANKMNLDRVNIIEIAKETINGLYDNIHTNELDIYASKVCVQKKIEDPQYDKLAGGIIISNLHKITDSDFLKVTEKLKKNVNHDKELYPLVSNKYYDFVVKNIDKINNALNYDRDYIFDYFGLITLEKSYLLKVKDYNKDINSMEFKSGTIVECPQHMWMRVSLALHLDNIDNALETYEYLSQGYFTHASPTLFNSGLEHPQMCSCYVMDTEDNIESIFGKTIRDSALLSKWAGGIGISLHDIRPKGSWIYGTNGPSSGIMPFIQNLDTQVLWINQGGKRSGAIATYIEPWHGDVYDFCTARTNKGDESLKSRNMFFGLWIPDLFMKRVLNNETWSLMCANKCKGLSEVYGDEFEELYTKYENEGKFIKQVKAVDLFNHIISAQFESGFPYMCYKDNFNKKTNHNHLGVIKSSNLCTEIGIYYDSDETAVCVLGSIALPKFLNKETKLIDYEKLIKVAGILVNNLNNIIDTNYYPTERSKISNMKHRPLGIGVQGLSDLYFMLDLPFESDQAKELNIRIFETIYYGALKKSCELAQIYGHYESFPGSPFSKGQLQHHMWGKQNSDLLTYDTLDWDALVEDIKKYGTRNSLLTAVMPTATTAHILGNSECIEPYTSNLYTRQTHASEFVIANKYLIEKLIENNLWTKNIRDQFIHDNGSIQKISEIPKYIKDIYKTAMEMNIKPLIDQSIDRAPFIDQSQSLNLFTSTPDTNKIGSAHIYGWKNGLKTGMYYLRSRPAVNSNKFGLDSEVVMKIKNDRAQQDFICDGCSA